MNKKDVRTVTINVALVNLEQVFAHLFKANNRNTWKGRHFGGGFFGNFEHISQLF